MLTGNIIYACRGNIYQSIALSNIRQCLEQLSIIHGKQFGLQITELKEEDGVVTGVNAVITISADIRQNS